MIRSNEKVQFDGYFEHENACHNGVASIKVRHRRLGKNV
jgi:hypothetical protein